MGIETVYDNLDIFVYTSSGGRDIHLYRDCRRIKNTIEDNIRKSHISSHPWTSRCPDCFGPPSDKVRQIFIPKSKVEIICTLMENRRELLNQSQIARRSGISRYMVNEYIDELVSMGIVDVDKKVHRTKFYTINRTFNQHMIEAVVA